MAVVASFMAQPDPKSRRLLARCLPWCVPEGFGLPVPLTLGCRVMLASRMSLCSCFCVSCSVDGCMGAWVHGLDDKMVSSGTILDASECERASGREADLVVPGKGGMWPFPRRRALPGGYPNTLSHCCWHLQAPVLSRNEAKQTGENDTVQAREASRVVST